MYYSSGWKQILEQASYREVINITELENLITDINNFKHVQEDRQIDNFVFKFLPISGRKESNISDEKLIDSREGDNQAKALYKKSNPKTFIIFADSLDLTILNNSYIKNSLPNINAVYKKSIYYRNFTSTGGWTYPCLHSMHTGIPPYISFCGNRHDPVWRMRARTDHIERSRKNHFYIHYILNSLDLNDKPLSSDNYLTRVLSREGFLQSAIKASLNHGWLHGLTHSIDLSIENPSPARTGENLDVINKIVGDSEVDTYFIDIDNLHKTDMFRREEGVNWYTNPLEWHKKSQGKYERLIGAYNDREVEIRRYLDKLIELDRILGTLLERINEIDNLILFSDHGSDLFPWEDKNPYERVEESILSPEKIWKPTLLVYAPNNKNFSGHLVSDELVSTVDLYSIILNLHCINNQSDFRFSLLPQSLGGKQPRESAYTFSHTRILEKENPFFLNYLFNKCCY